MPRDRDYCRRMEGDDLLFERQADARFATPGTKASYTPDRSFASVHMKLEVNLDIKAGTLKGRCSVQLRSLHDGADEIVFDAVLFKVRSVTIGGKTARFKHDGKKLKIRPRKAVGSGSMVTVVITYSVRRPPMGLFFIKPDRRLGRAEQVWTQGQDEYSRYWFPCLDAPEEKMSTEMIVSVPRGFVAVSNGRLLSKTKKGNLDVFHYSLATPYAPYLVTLTAGRFSIIEDTWNGIPVLYYCSKGREADCQRAFGKTPRMMEFFSQKLGVPYPYEKYAQIAASEFIYGGMENITATTQTDQVLCDNKAKNESSHEHLVAHELAHQWFGDLLTCKSWSHGWLNEGFATYFQCLWVEHEQGQDAFRYEMMENRRTYQGEAKNRYSRPMVTPNYKDPSDLFDRHLYEKGSWILHMIRGQVGDDLFFRALHRYVQEHRESVVETQDLVHAFREATGKNLQGFFDQWVYGAGYPDLRVHLDLGKDGRMAKVEVRQIQKTSNEVPLYKFPLKFWFDVPGGAQEFEETIEKRSHTFTFKLKKRPRIFRVDPAGWILKTLRVVQPSTMWMKQLKSDPDILGRIEAVVELGRQGTSQSIRALGEALSREKFWGIQAEIALVLGEAKTDLAYSILRAHANIRDVRARREVIRALAGGPGAQNMKVARAALKAKDSYHVPAQAARLIGMTGRPEAFRTLRSLLNRDSWNDTLRSGAIAGLTSIGSPEALSIIREHTKPSHSYQARMTSIVALGRLGQGMHEITKLLVDLTEDPNIRIQMAATTALGSVADPTVLPTLKKLTKAEHRDGRIRRMAEEGIRRLTHGQGISDKA